MTQWSLTDSHMQDKMIALEPDKAAFLYQIIRATGATRVIEAGTSSGVSTIYLALAVGSNARAAGLKPGTPGVGVVATEWEEGKVARARANWREAGPDVEDWIELRHGDLRETLKYGLEDKSVGLVLFDSKSLHLPLGSPHIRKFARAASGSVYRFSCC